MFTTTHPLALLGLGLLLGVQHAADPDHVVAIGAIAARTRRWWPAARLGIVWGLGHTLTLFVVAGGIILFDWVVPPRLGLALEICVGVALVMLGLVNVRSHSHESGAGPDCSGPRRAFLVGLVHGLAGSAAVALLVVGLVHDALWACAYLLFFGVGTLVGMTLITSGVALPLVKVAHRRSEGDWYMRRATGAVSVAMGVWVVYQFSAGFSVFR
jgi:hypothetical protein